MLHVPTSIIAREDMMPDAVQMINDQETSDKYYYSMEELFRHRTTSNY